MTGLLSLSAIADEGSSSILGQTGSDVRGQTGSNDRGQTGSNGRGQTGSNGRALTVADVLGQTGSGGRGQTGSNDRGQTGSNGRGQTGSNGRALTVADVLGQTGSGGRGQTGSNDRGQTGSSDRGQTGSDSRAVTSAAMGSIQSVGSSGQHTVVVVLGQAFTVDAASADTVRVGDYVVAVVAAADGEATLQKLGEPYIAGVSPVALVGVVSGVDTRGATLTIGGASVDYSSQLSLDPELLPSLGGVYETVGIQPTPGGAILAGLQYDGAVVSLSGPR